MSGPAFDLDPAVAGLAEDLNANLPLTPGSERIEDPRFVIWIGPGAAPAFNVVQRLRLTPDAVERAVAEVRDLFRARDRFACTWEVGASAVPADLADRLMAIGMAPNEEPLAAGMVLAEAPPVAPPGDLIVRQARTLDEFLAAAEIQIECFGMSPEHADEIRAWARRTHADGKPRSRGVSFIAYDAGEPVATAEAVFADAGVVLSGGCTLPRARGRGAYRALVVARWNEAVARGTPVLVTQAGRMSRPILRKLGFRDVVEIRIFLDEFGPTATR